MKKILTLAFLLTSTLANCQMDGINKLNTSKYKVVDSSRVLSNLVREPMLAQHPNGALFVTGYATIIPGKIAYGDLLFQDSVRRQII